MASVLALGRAEHKVAKVWFFRSRLAHVATLVLSVLTLFVGEPIGYCLAVGALLTEVVAFAARFYGDSRHAVAEDAGRAALLVDAVAIDEAVALRELRTQFSKRADALAPQFKDPDYYDSDAPLGVERLRDNLRESAFWSSDLYGTAARWTLYPAAGLVAIIVILFFVVAGVGAETTTLLVARLGVVFLSFLVFSDLLVQATAWRGAAARADRTYRRLTAASFNDLGEMLEVFAEYAVATAATPPIPDFVHRHRQDRIRRAWAGT